MSDAGYTPLRISTIPPERGLTFDLYIQFKDHYLKYIGKGDPIDTAKYNKLKEQKVARFYITASEEELYQKFLDMILTEALGSKTTPTTEKLNLSEGACQTAIERVSQNPSSRVSFNIAKRSAEGLRQVVTMNADALVSIYDRSVRDEDKLMKHCINVCALATKFASSLKFNETELNTLAVASLLHDLGLFKLPVEHQQLIKKSSKDMTPEEKLNYGKHTFVSAEMLAGKPYVTPEAMELIVNHEEKISGSGPQKKTKLSPSNALLSLVDSYDKRVSFRNCTPKDALKQLKIDELGNYDLELIKKFEEFLKRENLLIL